MTGEPDFWDKRLDNWCRCYLGGSALSGGSNLSRIVVQNSYWTETKQIVLLGEAHDTDELIHKLEQKYQQAIVAWYWWSGTKEQVAKRCGCHRVTLWERIIKAKELLSDLQFRARRDLLKREVEGAIGTPSVPS